MRSIVILGLTIVCLSPISVWSQDSTDEINPFEINFDTPDTASIFSLLDSLLDTDLGRLNYSQLVIKSGYASQIVAAGRDLGTNQFGVNFGASYYHNSGVYADLTAYINSQNSPRHYLTTFTLGYLGLIGNDWTYTLGYDHYFYRDPSDEGIAPLPFTDGLSASIYKSSGKFETGVDYSIVFGDDINAHKIYWSVMGNFKKDEFWFFDRVSLLPTFGMLFGNQSVISIRLNQVISRDFFRDQEVRNVFGLLNYNLSFPISMKYKKLNVLLSYQYNIPVNLPGEAVTTESNSFVGVNLSYFIDLKKKDLLSIQN